MPLLFSYGMLRHEDVQRALFGRTFATESDRLPGFAQTTKRVEDPEFVRSSGKAMHAVVRPTGNPQDVVEGVVLEVSEGDLETADGFEPAGWTRVEVALCSGRPAWVYVDSDVAGGRW